MDLSGAPLAVSLSCDIKGKNQSDCTNCVKCLRMHISYDLYQMVMSITLYMLIYLYFKIYIFMSYKYYNV